MEVELYTRLVVKSIVLSYFFFHIPFLIILRINRTHYIKKRYCVHGDQYLFSHLIIIILQSI